MPSSAAMHLATPLPTVLVQVREICLKSVYITHLSVVETALVLGHTSCTCNSQACNYES